MRKQKTTASRCVDLVDRLSWDNVLQVTFVNLPVVPNGRNGLDKHGTICVTKYVGEEIKNGGVGYAHVPFFCALQPNQDPIDKVRPSRVTLSCHKCNGIACEDSARQDVISRVSVRANSRLCNCPWISGKDIAQTIGKGSIQASRAGRLHQIVREFVCEYLCMGCATQHTNPEIRTVPRCFLGICAIREERDSTIHQFAVQVGRGKGKPSACCGLVDISFHCVCCEARKDIDLTTLEHFKPLKRGNINQF
mmetsp:Transcript_23719/g.55268  ORF Transcript_23719/g.55268 Transcript_23719/m.55268 type:complete len:250 (+) Transcript_23719:1079-1828(+)